MKINDTMHPAQVAILHVLLFSPAASFTELRQKSGLSSDHFNFHLKQMTGQKLISKTANGHYGLTPAGKEYANRFDTDERVIERQPKVAVLLAIENQEGKILCQERLKQPFYGFWGRPTGKIRFGETIMQAAARELMEEAGLTADLECVGVLHKMDYQEGSQDLLEDKIFFVMKGKNPRGDFTERFEGGRNAWLTKEEIANLNNAFPALSQSMPQSVTPGFITFTEKQYQYAKEQY